MVVFIGMDVIEALKVLQKDKSIKIKDIVEKLGIGRTYFYSLINGKRKLRKSTEENIARKLKFFFNIKVTNVKTVDEIDEIYLYGKIEEIIENNFEERITNIITETIFEYLFEENAYKKWILRACYYRKKGLLKKAIKCYLVAITLDKTKEIEIKKVIVDMLNAFVQMNIDPFMRATDDKEYLQMKNIINQLNNINP